MNEALSIRDFGQTEVSLRQSACEFLDDAHAAAIGNLSKLASEAKRKGDLQAALEHEEAALAICLEMESALGKTPSQAITAAKLYNLGQLHYQRQEFVDAKACFEQASHIDAASGNLIGQAADFRGLAFVKQDSGDLQGAVLLHKTALELDTRGGFAYEIAKPPKDVCS
jgi:tetratricopeptide (TPR) repeat protein